MSELIGLEVVLGHALGYSFHFKDIRRLFYTFSIFEGYDLRWYVIGYFNIKDIMRLKSKNKNKIKISQGYAPDHNP